MNLFNSEHVQTWASKHVRCRVEGVPDRFSLSFDDGPSPRYTPRVMETLARFGIARRGKILADTRDAKRGAFGGDIAGGHTHLFFPSPRFSPPRRGRIVSRLWYIHSTDFATLVSAKDAPAAGCSLSPRERVRVRGNDGSTATEYRISVGLITT